MNDIIILAMLLEGPKHGYRLKQEAAMFASSHQLHNNTVYPLLSRFLKSGWITKRKAEGERGQTRLLYQLTPAGKKTLAEKLDNFSEADATSEQAFHLRVGLFNLLGPASRERILHLRDQHLATRQQRMERISGPRVLEGWSAVTFEHVASEIANERKWIARLMTNIQQD